MNSYFPVYNDTNHSEEELRYVSSMCHFLFMVLINKELHDVVNNHLIKLTIGAGAPENIVRLRSTPQG